MSCCESEGTRVEVVCEILLACHEGGRYSGGGSGPAAGATYLRTGPAVPGPHWLVLVPPSSGHCGPARGPASLRSSGPLERQGAWREGLEEVQGLGQQGRRRAAAAEPGCHLDTTQWAQHRWVGGRDSIRCHWGAGTHQALNTEWVSE